ncbi:histidine phosphatase family protein [Methylocapsa sp. S129]|uniref:histidine phosphatase family protein n=1 Tax=Methylocapsa sp. S129 TaxID=1641869 RepID=UPI00131D32B9|nr:histidine phosphatase family protein [Methylocapsa sp. S129]
MAPSYPHRLIFVRHGQTAYNAENRLQGQRDVPLNGKGREQAGAVGRFLRDHWGAELVRLDTVGAFWASPLGRTRQTMELARVAMGLPPQPYRVDARLEELSFGDWEGLNWDEVEARDPEGIKARQASKWGFAPPHGESYADLVERVKPWLAERDGDAFVVAHGGVARAFMAILAGVAPSIAAEAEIWQGRALIFDKGAFSWVG